MNAAPHPATPAQSIARTLRVLRAVRPPESPLVGRLVWHGDHVRLAVSARALTGWPGWNAPSAHVWSVVDVAIDVDAAGPQTGRADLGAVVPPHPDETIALLPRLIAPLDAFSPAFTQSRGCVTTAIVSVVRGWGAVRRACLSTGEGEPEGRWWVSDDGTPVFVTLPPAQRTSDHRAAVRSEEVPGDASGAGEQPPMRRDATSRASAAQLVRLRRASGDIAMLVDDVLDLVERGDFAGAEDAAFAFADPEPIDVVARDDETESPSALPALERTLGREDAVQRASSASAGRRLTWDDLGGRFGDEGAVERQEGTGRPAESSAARARIVAALAGLVRRHVDPDLATTVRDAGAWDVGGGPARKRDARRARAVGITRARGDDEASERGTRPRRRRGPWLLAAAAVIVVVAVGLALPTGAGEGSGAERTGATAPMAAPSAPSPAAGSGSDEQPTSIEASSVPPAATHADTETDTGASAAADDPAAAANALMMRWSECRRTCVSDVFVDPAASEWPTGASLLPPERRTTTVLDDLGAAAVVRIDATDPAAAPAHHLVLTRTAAGWRVSSVRPAS